jgi:hypothetical protein
MSKRWFVHRNNQSMGPWTADAIRAALREGTIDPFDLVNAEGSPVMRELVEIDEIFQTENVDYKDARGAAAAATTSISTTKKTQGGILALAEPNIEKRVASNRTSTSSRPQDATFFTKLRGREKPKLRAPQPISEGNLTYDRAKSAMSESVGKYSDPKRYFLIDARGRILGPKSAGEIQSLYYRGVLDQNVHVRKNQSDVSVSIVRFVEVYAQAKGGGKRAPVIAAHPVPVGGGLPQPGKFQEFRENAVTNMKVLQTSKYLTMVSIICLIVSAGFGLYIYQNSVASRDSSASRKGVIINRTTKKLSKLTAKKGIDKREESAVPLTQSNAMEADDQREEELESTVDNTNKSEDQGRQTAKSRENVVADQKNSASATPSRRLELRPGARRLPAVSQTRNRVAIVRRPNPPLVQARPTPVAPPPASPIAALAGRNGQVVKIGTLRFREDDLTRCTVKCEINMTDGAGRTIVAKFFKDSFGGQLQGKSNGAVITGRILSGGQAVLVTGVQ